MSRPIPGACLALLCLAALSGCGYVGEPLPPALDIPMPVGDLRAIQRGDKLLVYFTIAPLTTDGIPVAELREVDLRIGPGGGPPFQVDRWAATAKSIPADVTDPGLVTVTVPVAEWAGKEVFLAVRAKGRKNRWSSWSNVFTLTTATALSSPANVVAEATASGVHLTWGGNSPTFRVFRKGPQDPELVRIGDASKPEYTDSTAQYGTTYEYVIQAAVKAGAGEVESEPSPPVTITPDDKFPPAVPTGLNALAGAGSIQLGWDRDTDADLAGYFVYRAEGDGPFARLGDRIDVPSYSDRAIKAGTKYRYRISAVDLRGNESAQSPPVEITP